MWWCRRDGSLNFLGFAGSVSRKDDGLFRGCWSSADWDWLIKKRFWLLELFRIVKLRFYTSGLIIEAKDY